MLTLFNSQFSSSDLQQSTPCQKPLEIYSVIDPLCPECWSLEPVLKKLQVEYGQYFTLRHFIGGNLESFNAFTAKRKAMKSAEQLAEKWERTASLTGMSCDGDLWLENPISAPYLASLAIKAAELQGKQVGLRFLRKMRENLFLEKQNIGNQEVLAEIAQSVGLDVHEFLRDLCSDVSFKALQCDLKFSTEMDVTHFPTLIIFNDRADEEGIKVSGCYSYEVYVEMIREMLGYQPERAPLPDLLDFLKKHSFVATKEVSVVFDWTNEETEKVFKKLLLQQVVEKVPVKYGTFWRYISE